MVDPLQVIVHEACREQNTELSAMVTNGPPAVPAAGDSFSYVQIVTAAAKAESV